MTNPRDDGEADDIAKQEAESVADAKRRLAKRSGTNPRDDGEAVAKAFADILDINACDDRCRGRCQECPNDTARRSVETLRTEIDRLSRQLAEARAERDMHSEARVFAANRAYRAESDLAEAQGVIERQRIVTDEMVAAAYEAYSSDDVLTKSDDWMRAVLEAALSPPRERHPDAMGTAEKL